ncbi:VCBS repeat-containing protein [Aliifodinibius sp. S!AR15-10]|uniref:VCBS repeat-containing protein n=1 Tax=Aliifodinibius sp. S!AR15-10 TaxID=2950437 RepID=UPI00286596FA|nr:VCBS repeat-containing protein [Aliifodinibius sp. S!AR15-10]MDR8392514.1 VCBS repeat-containing protein [Aliifodinibius sp. S!AR15-10]
MNKQIIRPARSSVILIVTFTLLLYACEPPVPKRFSQLSPDITGITFINRLTPTPELNIFNYLYFYDGGGVAAGDLNGDDLPELFFTSNQEENKIYLNKGNFEFEDVTDIAIGTSEDEWTTGVSFVDINSDGKLDIYVCNVGGYLNLKGTNRLYINKGNNEQGIPVFEEKAGEYSLDLMGFGTQAAFFDYDLDGDLDMYMMNHSVHSAGTFDYSTIRQKPHPLAGDKLMRNDGGRFVDVTEHSGIYSSALGYGLGIGISDLNQDGYPDVYIGNDFHEDDYLYINNGDGTFTESLEEMIQHTSRSSMGNDLVDINNDGLVDIFSLDMLPEDYEKLKATAGEDTYQIYESKRRYGYKHQFSRNTLQLNRGRGKFSEIGLMAGVYATDWSWAALGADFDHDGHMDLFVSNGIRGRSNDLDYYEYITQDAIQNRLKGKLTEQDVTLSNRMPVIKIPNYIFKNDGSLIFENVSNSWGLDQETFSNGAAYADLDLDGDLDIIINNVDQEASIFRNNTVEAFPNANYLKIKLVGPKDNRLGVGTKIEIPLGADSIIFRELYPVRGYQSSVEYTLHVGLDTMQVIPELTVKWPDGKSETLMGVTANQTVTIYYHNALAQTIETMLTASVESPFTEITRQLAIPYKHEENSFVEYTREPLIPHMISKEGPAIAVGDVNGDGLDDFYAGGAKRQAGKLFIQQHNGSFIEKESFAFQEDYIQEDVDATFGDFDNDSDLDLIVVSGGNEYYGHSDYMLPRLYLNDGSGHFLRSRERLPDLYITGSVVAKGDVDNDGDIDLFVGARAIPLNYGKPPTSYLLVNENGSFKIDTTAYGKSFTNLGMVTDAEWADMNKDGKIDLVVASEWSPLRLVYNLQKKGGTSVVELPNSTGLWNAVTLSDLDNDGFPDIIAGNLGLNSKFRAFPSEPLRMYVNDFDRNGIAEQIITYIDHKGEERLFATKDELATQLNYINERFESYKSFGETSLHDVIDRKLLSSADKYEVDELRSSLFYNKKDHFAKEPMPVTSQFAPMRDFFIYDLDNDHYSDIIGAGNFYEAAIQRGRYDASFGNVLLNRGDRGLQEVSNSKLNWFLEGEIRKIKKIRLGDKDILVVAANNAPLRFFLIEPFGRR